jgi:hypothetical protein
MSFLLDSGWIKIMIRDPEYTFRIRNTEKLFGAKAQNTFYLGLSMSHSEL